MAEHNRIGIILSLKRYRGLLNRNRNELTMAQLYTEAAKNKNCKVCFFRLSDLKLGKKVVNCLIENAGQFKITTIPIPKVIYKRTGHSKKKLHVLQSLIDQGTIIFNFYKENYKWNIWKMINRSETLSKYQPYTKIASVKSIKSMMKRYPSIMIKPNRGEAGRGIMKIEKTAGRNWVLYTKDKNRGWKRRLFKNKLPKILVRRIKQKQYLVQETIDLSTYKGARFDMRVSIQMNRDNEWTLSAIFVKVAKTGELLTNIGQGGTAFTLAHILHSHPTLQLEKVKQQVIDLGVNLAKHLSQYKPGVYDFGFDIGISKDGLPFLFEVNHINDYPAFSIIGGTLVNKEWYAVYKNPIEFASSLLCKDKK